MCLGPVAASAHPELQREPLRSAQHRVEQQAGSLGCSPAGAREVAAVLSPGRSVHVQAQPGSSVEQRAGNGNHCCCFRGKRQLRAGRWEVQPWGENSMGSWAGNGTAAVVELCSSSVWSLPSLSPSRELFPLCFSFGGHSPGTAALGKAEFHPQL